MMGHKTHQVAGAVVTEAGLDLHGGACGEEERRQQVSRVRAWRAKLSWVATSLSHGYSSTSSPVKIVYLADRWTAGGSQRTTQW